MAKTRKTPAQATPSPAQVAPGRGPGVIARLVDHLQHGGGTAQELFEKLKADFPDRGDGMLTTVKIQLRRLPQQGKVAIHKEEVDGHIRYTADPPTA